MHVMNSISLQKACEIVGYHGGESFYVQLEGRTQGKLCRQAM